MGAAMNIGAGHYGTRSAAVASSASEERVWQALVVEHLRGSKRRGVPWEDAQVAAARAVHVRSQDAAAPSLFDEAGEAHDTAAAFFWRVAEEAYVDYVGPVGSGSGPALREFSIDLVDDDVRLSPVMAA